MASAFKYSLYWHSFRVYSIVGWTENAGLIDSYKTREGNIAEGSDFDASSNKEVKTISLDNINSSETETSMFSDLFVAFHISLPQATKSGFSI